MRNVTLPICLALSLMVPVLRTTVSASTTVVLVDDMTLGFYNAALGTSLDGTQPQFPPANLSGGDPTIVSASEPGLAAVATILGGWLSPTTPLPLNPNWSGLQPIPSTWAVNTETAIIYPIDAGPGGLVNVRGNFGIDNGIFVWVNGVFQFGAVAPGEAPAFEYADIDLGILQPGMNFIQILREDHGVENDYTVRITGERLEAGEFAINLTTFIPGNFIQGPPQERCFTGFFPPELQQLVFATDDRTFAPAAPSFRTRQLVTVIPDQTLDPDGLQEGSERHLVGETKAYAEDALEDGRLDAADDDAVLLDCHLLHERERAEPAGMRITVNRVSAQSVTVRMFGGPGNPLEFGGSLAGIDWDITITINTESLTPFYTLIAAHDAFPAFELYINNQEIYRYDPGPPPYGADELLLLLPPLDVFDFSSGVLLQTPP